MPGSVTIWGLTPRQIHDAFWRSRGVECVRRGDRKRLDRHADLFLLLEPEQMVLFNIAEISERLTWHNALITRLRLVDEGAQRYSEHVVTDEAGFVKRIERRYGPTSHSRTITPGINETNDHSDAPENHALTEGGGVGAGWGDASSRVVITSVKRIASTWMTAESRHDGWDRVRRSVAWSRVDHWKCEGSTFLETDERQTCQMIDELVERWPRPDLAISGLVEFDRGVWQINGDVAGDGVVRIGPLWLGHGGDLLPQRESSSNGHRCMIGPAWTPDRVAPDLLNGQAAALRRIVDVELPGESRDAVTPPNVRAGVYLVFKRAFDFTASLSALLILSPVMAVVGLLILIDSGRPLFFGHMRQGRLGRQFRCWKFRTMYRDADQLADGLGENICDGPQVYIPNDPRVTRVGRILRATNFDELPQLFNVLIGQMSLVGPRPSPDEENQFCPAWRDTRLSVRPGITGLWQLKRTRGQGEDFQEWIKYDIEYVQKASFLLDFFILLKTAKLLVTGRPGRRAS